MNHLLAKTKGKNGGFYKVLSDHELFSFPDDLDNSKVYCSNYKLEEDEWFSITSFSEKKYFPAFLKHEFISTDYNQIAVDDYNKIDFLCSLQKDIYYFQKISSSQIIRKKYFRLSEAPVLVENEPIIVIDSFPDAIYDKDTDNLYFKILSSITNIFKGIDELYKEATKEETECFLSNDFILLDKKYSAENVKSANRKRISMAMETLPKFSFQERQELLEYIRDYCTDLNYNVNENKFFISNEDELKKLIFGIEQRYYTTKLKNERRLANSVIPI